MGETKGDESMATNPVGKDTKTIGINMNQKMAGGLEARAESMYLSTSKYCKTILMQWIESGKQLTLKERGYLDYPAQLPQSLIVPTLASTQGLTSHE